MPTTDTPSAIRIWVAAYVAANRETAVRDAAEARAYPALLPTGLVEVSHARRRMLVERPVFPRYVFLGVPEGASWYPLRAVPGVLGILSSGQQPRAVPKRVVGLLEEAIAANAFTRTAEAAFAAGEAVKVRVGSAELDAFVERVRHTLPGQRIDVVFEAMGKRHRATVPLDHVRAAG
ncbi:MULTISPECIES: transcription termination/antitermination protein NusG [Methylobacterium]|uniref:transcription termination/antitermination protein NusG n=1 Tax=Methylobacterium TaxID=407 RepID=UPI0013EC318C|nr:transcription termination/antitermination NusG family protein [Methylobacterium sp. DB0501]NGM34505.1 hypothetical protein [Methylobacterium sp. DB0501]